MKRQNGHMATKVLAFCALLAAISIVLARVLSYAQPGGIRLSLDKFPLFLAGLLFGPMAGAMTGFVADFLGSLMQFGFNPIFCPPAIFYGLCGGLLRWFVAQNPSVPRLTISYLLPVAFGSWLYQSVALAWVYGETTFWEAFYGYLISRGVQFSITLVLEVTILYLLIQTKLFNRLGIWPPKKKKKGCCDHDG